jgi:hypothetical protein
MQRTANLDSYKCLDATSIFKPKYGSEYVVLTSHCPYTVGIIIHPSLLILDARIS